jgi:hypothetical protein
MSPFCLINVAEIRDHAVATSPDLREPVLYARLTDWVLRLLRLGRG